MMLPRLRRPPWRILGSVAAWHVTSQQHARRNALVASTALAQCRRERVEVEEFLAARARGHVDARRSASRTA